MAAMVLTRKRTSIWGILAVMAAMATGLAVYSYLSYVRSQIPVAGKLVDILVAARDIGPGETITATMVKTDKQPSRYMPKQAITSRSAVLGRVVNVPLFEGEALTTRKFGQKGGLSSVVPSGQRAYSLSIASGAGLAFAPQAGDRVDVIATLPQEAIGQATTVTVLRSKEVASVGPPSEAQEGKPSERFGVGGAVKPNLGITLFVDPREAERLAMAEALGKITIVLAPDGPPDGPAPEPVKANDIAI